MRTRRAPGPAGDTAGTWDWLLRHFPPARAFAEESGQPRQCVCLGPSFLSELLSNDGGEKD